MGESISKGRAWAIVTILLVAVIVAVGVGLGLGLQKKGNDNEDNDTSAMGNGQDTKVECPKPRTSDRLTKDSPIYVRPTESKEGSFRFSSVASDSPPCSYIGTEMMARHGGSAVDAAIATILCAGVYNPQSCGIGGGFFMTYYKKSEKKAYAIMGREMAPAAATQNMYKAEGVSSRTGAMAIGIPGEVQGLYEAWKLGGELPWETLFRPAIKMCIDGFKVGTLLAHDIENNKQYYANYTELNDTLTNPETKELYQLGETITLPKLGATFEKIAADPFTFYNGTLADDIVNDIKDKGGIITKDDLESYTAAVKDPLVVTLKDDYKVYSPPPPSSGGVLLLILNILNGYSFNETSVSTVEKTVDTYHKIIEAFKHGYSIRTNIGDDDFEDQAFKDRIVELISNMTSPSFGESKRNMITKNTHDTDYYEPTYSVTTPDAGTSHLSVLGANGDAVSITSTINIYFGSKVVGFRTGIVFNDEMDDFSTPNTTNYFGIPASPANFIKPYKRPLSSMSPSIVVNKDGDVNLVVGASGGSRIITSTALTIMQTLWFKLGVKESIDYPRVHHQLLPTKLRVENRFLQTLLDGLSARGHEFDITSSSGSAVQAVLQRKENDIFANCDHSKFGVSDGS